MLTCFFWISFTYPSCFSVIEYSLFALSCIFFSLIEYSLIFVPPFGCSAVNYVHWMNVWLLICKEYEISFQFGNLFMAGKHGWNASYLLFWCVSLFFRNLIYMSCLFFSNRIFIVCSQLYIFLTNKVFTYICASFWLFCCYLCTLDGRTDGCLGVIGLSKWWSGSCIVEASMHPSLAMHIILRCEHLNRYDSMQPTTWPDIDQWTWKLMITVLFFVHLHCK
jgi:hypothetical protein